MVKKKFTTKFFVLIFIVWVTILVFLSLSNQLKGGMQVGGWSCHDSPHVILCFVVVEVLPIMAFAIFYWFCIYLGGKGR